MVLRTAPGLTCRLTQGDCLDVIASLPDACVDLLYVDPPFASGKTRRGRAGDFADQWPDVESYVSWLVERLAAARRLLKDSGNLYVHLDWHAVHYVKVALDQVYGYDNFLNEVIWVYGLGGSSPRYWPRKHDTLLWYAREAGRHWFEASRVPAASQRMRGQSKKAPDVWDIPSLNNMARERVGYPTQKPEALLTRIIESSCPPGGTVADLFCGSGTTAVVADRLGRAWIACDTSQDALAVTRRRLTSDRAPHASPAPRDAEASR